VAPDWLNRPLNGGSVSELIARKKYGRAIEVLSAQFKGRSPGPQMRLQLADLLILAGRGAEAVPILISLADGFAGDGFVAKAVAILKRVDRIEPGRAEVELRLVSLVRQQQRSGPAERTPSASPAPRKPKLPEIGIEEIDTSHDAILHRPARTEPDLPLEPAPVAEAAPEVQPPPVEPEPAREPVAEAMPAPPDAAAPEAAQPVADAPRAEGPSAEGVVHRIRGVFRRFLSSLPGSEEAPAGVPAEGQTEAPPAADTLAPPAEEPAAAVPPPSEAASQPPTENVEAAPAAPAAETAPPVETAPPAEATAESLLPAPEPAPAEPTAAPTPPDEPGVSRRIRSVLRRFLSSLPGPPAAEAAAPAPEAAPAAAEPAAAVEPPPAESAPATPPPPPTEAEVVLEADSAAEELVVEAEEAPLELPAEAITLEGDEPRDAPMSEEAFEGRVLDLIQDVLHQPSPPAEAAPAAPAAGPEPAPPRGLAPRLLASPLFGDLSELELLAVIRELELLTFEAGDIVVTEGEHGDSMYIVAAGAIKVFVRNPQGRNFVVSRMSEGDFFGEISSLSGRPRTATVVAATRCELLVLKKDALDGIAHTHPRVRDVLEAYYIQRSSNPEAAAVRTVTLGDAKSQQRAIEVLEAHFGESRWDPRMRLRLADLLLRSGKEDDAVPILIGLADDLAREGFPEKAIAIIKKVERIQHKYIEEVNLAPLKRAAPQRAPVPSTPPAVPAPPPPPAATPARKARQRTQGFFQAWLVDVVRDQVLRRLPASPSRSDERLVDPEALRAYGHGLRASPLFEGFSEEELLDLIRGLRLMTFEPGDVILTEGEPGEGLFILAIGTVRVFIRNPAGRSIALRDLGEGSCFGEISTLSGRPRCATVVAASRCELLELDKPTVDALSQAHPRVRAVLEELYIERATSPQAESIRSPAD
jgi:CRP-like cAMP-binding protein